MKVACILTAAGRSERFGRDKLTYPINGKPMLEHSLALFATLNFNRKVIVTQSKKAEACNLAKQYGFEVEYNDDVEMGISRSVVVGVKAVLNHDKPDGILFAVADQPFLTVESVQNMLNEFVKKPTNIIRLASRQRQGNPVIFPKETFSHLLQLQGDVGGRAVIDKFKEKLYICNVAQDCELMDIDTRLEAEHVRN